MKTSCQTQSEMDSHEQIILIGICTVAFYCKHLLCLSLLVYVLLYVFFFDCVYGSHGVAKRSVIWIVSTIPNSQVQSTKSRQTPKYPTSQQPSAFLSSPAILYMKSIDRDNLMSFRTCFTGQLNKIVNLFPKFQRCCTLTIGKFEMILIIQGAIKNCLFVAFPIRRVVILFSNFRFQEINLLSQTKTNERKLKDKFSCL